MRGSSFIRTTEPQWAARQRGQVHIVRLCVCGRAAGSGYPIGDALSAFKNQKYWNVKRNDAMTGQDMTTKQK